jgi:hypothetical protein
MDAATQGDTEGRWLTYAELAELRRIDKTSALKLAIRRKWPRRKDNHGTMQVCVPLDWAGPAERVRDGGMDVSTIVRPLEAAISALQVQLDRSEAGREAADRRADQAEVRADRADARAERAEARADAAQQAEAARRSLGLVARLRAAWRGE